MTLWNIIRDFFVENIFGGVNSNGNVFVGGTLGKFVLESGSQGTFKASDFFIPLNGFSNYGATTYLSLGDWLSSTFTIITLILLVCFLFIFVKWIFKLFAGLLH